MRSGRAPFIHHAIAPVFVTGRGLGICDYARFVDLSKCKNCGASIGT